MEKLEKEAEDEKKILEPEVLIKPADPTKKLPGTLKRSIPKSNPVKNVESKPVEIQQPKAVMKKRES